MLAGIAPWADPELVAIIEAEAGPRNGVLLDPVSQTIPWSRAARDDLLFNPSQGAGAALLGNGQSAVLFPSEAASRLIAPFRAVTYSQAARLLLAAWGTFLLIRCAGFTELAGAASAAIYLGSGFLQLWRLHPHSLVAATTPWILAAALALWRRPGPRSTVLLAAAGAIGVSAGHPETLLHVVLFTAMAVPALAWVGRDQTERRSTSPRPRRLGWQGRSPGRGAGPAKSLPWGIAAAGLSFLLAAPVLLPFVETLRVSTEWTERRPQGRTNVEVPLREALERLRPAGALHALGDPVEGTWGGPENLAELGGGATGGAALWLAVLGMIATRGRARSGALWSIAAVGLLGLAVGAHMPVVSAPFGWVPLLEDTLLKRLSLWWVLAVTILAAAGIDAWVDATAGGRRRLAIGVAVAALVALLGVALAIGDAPSSQVQSLWIAEGAPVIATVLAALLLLSALPVSALRASGLPASVLAAAPVPSALPVKRRGAGRAIAAASLVLAALVVPRVALFARWVPVTPPEGFYSEAPALNVVVDRISELPRVGFRVTGFEAALTPHSAAFYGLEEIRPYDPMTFAPYQTFLTSVADDPGLAWVRVIDPRAPSLAFLGARFLLEDPPPPLPTDPSEATNASAGSLMRRRSFFRTGLRLAYEGPDAVVWERGDALPRAFFPRAWRVEDGGRALAAAAEIVDFAALAVVDRAPLRHALAPDVVETALHDRVTRAVENAAARALALEVGRRSIAVEVEVESSDHALLATSQPAIPGWRLTVDGAAATHLVRRVNGAFLGVAVPPGRHRVVLRFAPRSWTIGLLLAGAGVVCSALLLQVDRRRS